VAWAAPPEAPVWRPEVAVWVAASFGDRRNAAAGVAELDSAVLLEVEMVTVFAQALPVSRQPRAAQVGTHARLALACQP